MHLLEKAMIFKKIFIAIGLLCCTQAFCPEMRKPWLRWSDPFYRKLPQSPSNSSEPLGSPKKLFFEGILERLDWMQEFIEAYRNEPQAVRSWFEKTNKAFKPFERAECKDIWDASCLFLRSRLFTEENFKKVLKAFFVAQDPLFQDYWTQELDQAAKHFLDQSCAILNWNKDFYFPYDFGTRSPTRQNATDDEMHKIRELRIARTEELFRTILRLKTIVKFMIARLKENPRFFADYDQPFGELVDLAREFIRVGAQI